MTDTEEQPAPKFKIIDGPSRLMLIRSLCYSTMTLPFYVRFTLQTLESGRHQANMPFYIVEASIFSMLREDGTGQSWELRGRVSWDHKLFHCYYDTTAYAGTFTYLPAL